MINVACSRICEYDGCDKFSSYNYEGEKRAKFCAAHKAEEMVDVMHKTCKTYLCGMQVKKKYDGYCFRCFCLLFPDKPVVRNYKTKEVEVFNFVKTTFPDQTWIADKIIQDGCSKKRPDILCDLGYQVLIVEVDENSHRSYDSMCENKRISTLSSDIAHRPLIIIRFNPDKYIDKNGEQIKSCWSTSKETNRIRVDKSQQAKWKARLQTLAETIKHWINPKNTTKELVKIVELFYDQNMS